MEVINEDFYKIIAIRFGNMVYFANYALDKMKENDNDYCQLISRLEFKMMNRLDLGDKWVNYAEHAPILFQLNHDTPFDIRMRRPHGIKINDHKVII